MTFRASSVSPTRPTYIDLLSIPASATTDIVSVGRPVSNISNSLKPAASQGIRIEVTGPNTGNLLVNFDQSSLVRPIQNVSLPIYLTTTTSGANATITGCSPSAAGGSGTVFAHARVRFSLGTFTLLTSGSSGNIRDVRATTSPLDLWTTRS
ncbi:MAG: hypothetical protein HC902_11030 [Calothrix sp. SM1_5_4]|nr:hypothetical protein [Calothrix sp. SM1_5_4]